MADKNEDAPDGFEQLRAKLAGNLKAPMGEKLDFDLIELERGAVPLIGPEPLRSSRATSAHCHWNSPGNISPVLLR